MDDECARRKRVENFSVTAVLVNTGMQLSQYLGSIVHWEPEVQADLVDSVSIFIRYYQWLQMLRYAKQARQHYMQPMQQLLLLGCSNGTVFIETAAFFVNEVQNNNLVYAHQE